MCKAVEDYAKKERQKERIETIKSFIKDGSLSIEKIAEIVRLPIEDVQKIARSEEHTLNSSHNVASRMPSSA